MLDIYLIRVKACDGNIYEYEAVNDGRHTWSLEQGYERRIIITLPILETRFVRRVTRGSLSRYKGARIWQQTG